MHRRSPLALLLCLAAMAIFSPPASAVEITKHDHYRDPMTHMIETAVYTVDVAPPDSDDDGYANADDGCPHDGYTGNGGCTPPPPPEPAPVESVPTSSYSGGSYAIPSYIVECESGGDYTAVNPDSGAGGAYQFLPSTWTSLGYSGAPQDAPPAVQDEAAARYYAMAGSSPWVCG